MAGGFAFPANLRFSTCSKFVVGGKAVGARDRQVTWTFIGVEVITTQATTTVDLLTLVRFTTIDQHLVERRLERGRRKGSPFGLMDSEVIAVLRDNTRRTTIRHGDRLTATMKHKRGGGLVKNLEQVGRVEVTNRTDRSRDHIWTDRCRFEINLGETTVEIVHVQMVEDDKTIRVNLRVGHTKTGLTRVHEGVEGLSFLVTPVGEYARGCAMGLEVISSNGHDLLIPGDFEFWALGLREIKG
jgi:hypothetical protein